MRYVKLVPDDTQAHYITCSLTSWFITALRPSSTTVRSPEVDLLVELPNVRPLIAWKIFGGSSWGWSGLLPYFKKAETVDAIPAPNPWNDTSAPNPAYEGFDGPTQVSDRMLCGFFILMSRSPVRFPSTRGTRILPARILQLRQTQVFPSPTHPSVSPLCSLSP